MSNPMVIASYGQRLWQILHSRSSESRQCDISTTATPIITLCFSASERRVIAPLGQTCVQRLQSSSQYPVSNRTMGARNPATPPAHRSGFMILVGQTRTQFPQRTHTPVKRRSSIAPGGRKVRLTPFSVHFMVTAAHAAPSPMASRERRASGCSLDSAGEDLMWRAIRAGSDRISCAAPSGHNRTHQRFGHTRLMSRTIGRPIVAISTELLVGMRKMLKKPLNMPNGSSQSSKGYPTNAPPSVIKTTHWPRGGIFVHFP